MKKLLHKNSAILTLLSTVAILVYIYPELAQVIEGESIGDGISIVAFGALALALIFGIQTISWARERGRLNDVQSNFALLSLTTIVIVGNLVVLYYVPDTPEAIGVLVVTVLTALLVLRDTLSESDPSKN
ncbi:hypothetical protein [Salarchaeum sp. JOR-1]|uniref:hypothetical protein n=1 Tax=Salarchaeum sp. JOR-1 TaxID=2599399 RepID=UPI0011989A27|nr:hypothetical protein [Salarchaeum sp. JOR-1]QDX41056.1 hypothetical protein FQU85_09155 [Salarchaeum sp. JOR-1]